MDPREDGRASGRPRPAWRTRLSFAAHESAGALGDIGTFVPLAVGMVRVVGLHPGAVLASAGVVSVLTGLVFRIPVAVQPMKAVAAIAIGGAMTAPEVAGAGLFVGACVLLMGSLGWIGKAAARVPRAVLCGLQLAVAAVLIQGGVKLLIPRSGSDPSATSSHAWIWALVVLLAAVTVVLRRHTEWVALGLVAAGLLSAAMTTPGLLHAGGISLWTPHLALDASAIAGFWKGGLPQLPLTLLNSVIAASAVALELFGDGGRRASPTRLAISVGLMNLLTCPFGGLPVCHGSGGIAGQHRMGARTGWSMVILGLVQIGLGVGFGGLALLWMHAFPAPILGVFLAAAGFSLAEASRFRRTKGALVAGAVMALTQVASGSLVAGFAAGWVAHSVDRRLRATGPDALPVAVTSAGEGAGV